MLCNQRSEIKTLNNVQRFYLRSRLLFYLFLFIRTWSKHTLTLPPSYLKIHSFIVILLFSLHLFYGHVLCNLAIQATETNERDLI